METASEEIETAETVTRVEDILDAKSTDTVATAPNKESKKNRIKGAKSLEKQIPKGKPKSGRIWKQERKRFSSIIKTRGIHLSLDKKQELREGLKRIKEMSQAIKAQRAADKEAKKQRRILNLKRTEENRKKSEVVQVITNTSKLKKIKKKQLRMIEKRDTVNLQTN